MQNANMPDQSYFLRITLQESEYEQEMPQSQTADQLMAPQGRDTEHRLPQHKVKQAALFLSPVLG